MVQQVPYHHIMTVYVDLLQRYLQRDSQGLPALGTSLPHCDNTARGDVDDDHSPDLSIPARTLKRMNDIQAGLPHSI